MNVPLLFKEEILRVKVEEAAHLGCQLSHALLSHLSQAVAPHAVHELQTRQEGQGEASQAGGVNGSNKLGGHRVEGWRTTQLHSVPALTHRMHLFAPRVQAAHQPCQELGGAVAALGQAGKQLGRRVPGARGEPREQVDGLLAASGKAAQQLVQLLARQDGACRAEGEASEIWPSGSPAAPSLSPTSPLHSCMGRTTRSFTRHSPLAASAPPPPPAVRTHPDRGAEDGLHSG